jgi:hypothetical protein
MRGTKVQESVPGFFELYGRLMNLSLQTMN